MSTLIGGYWKMCVPTPTVVISTTLDLTRSVVIEAPIPTSITRKLSASTF